MTVRIPLLQILADGRFHSGERLGEQLAVTRAAIWKQLRALEAMGLKIQAVRGRGYRLAYPIELLEVEAIRAALPQGLRQRIVNLDIFPEIDSTNAYLKRQAMAGGRSHSLCLAEWQTAGRGRQGREWVSPFGCNLYLSLLWRFNQGPTALSGLSLAVGVAMARALRIHCGEGLGLKWPNDLYWRGRKLAGVLVEVAGDTAGPCHAVVGIGVNVRMPDRIAERIQQPWIDLYRISGRSISRNALAAQLVEQLFTALDSFEQQGLSAFLEQWRALDVTAGKNVQLRLPNQTVDGQAQGIDDNGAFVIQVGSEIKRYASGEISLRMIS